GGATTAWSTTAMPKRGPTSSAPTTSMSSTAPATCPTSSGLSRRRPLSLPRPHRLGALDLLAVDPRLVHALLEEADVAGDGGHCRQGIGVAPRRVLHDRAAGRAGPVPGLALVRAAGDGVRRRQQVHANLELGDVVPHRQAGLEDEHGPGGLGHGFGADHDADLARGPAGVDTVVRIAGMDEDLLVLLEPVIELVPVERHVALDVGPIGDGFL